MIIAWVGIVVLTLLFYGADLRGIYWWVIPTSAGLVLWLFFVVRFMQRSSIGRQLKGVPGIDEPYVYTFSDEGIAIAGRLTTTNIKWEAIIKARESKSDFLFFTTKRFAQFLPKRAFQHNGEMDELRVLLNQKLGTRAQLLA